MHISDRRIAVVPVVLSGGSGTRLWPMSRQLYPKQFIPLTGAESLFQATFNRLKGVDVMQPPTVVCNHEHRFMAAEQLRKIGITDATILLEPLARNTAPAIGVAAIAIHEREPEAIMLVLPADHLIQEVASFHEAIKVGIEACTQDYLLTFGVIPDRPETGYGYIHRGQAIADAHDQFIFYAVDAFVEKPDLNKAKEYLTKKTYLWNSGMFMFKASRYLQELEDHAPDIHSACKQAYLRRRSDLDFIRLDEDSFANSPKGSIDYAVMEKTKNAVVVPLQAGWSDVGAWDALWEARAHRETDNVAVGDAVLEDCEGCYVHANQRLVAVLGFNDVVVIETADAVLVIPKNRAQDVRQIVDRLKASKREEINLHRKVFRPWGTYEAIAIAERFQVKRITVNPGHSLSLQRHHHRAEHWVVVKGTARVIRDDKEFLLSENQSTYIPLGVKHRLENPGKIPLELIEVQSGSYLGEDDITRLKDNYGR